MGTGEVVGMGNGTLVGEEDGMGTGEVVGMGNGTLVSEKDGTDTGEVVGMVSRHMHAMFSASMPQSLSVYKL